MQGIANFQRNLVMPSMPLTRSEQLKFPQIRSNDRQAKIVMRFMAGTTIPTNETVVLAHACNLPGSECRVSCCNGPLVRFVVLTCLLLPVMKCLSFYDHCQLEHWKSGLRFGSQSRPLSGNKMILT
eukprot:3172079-Amphidinium_carterae.1